MYLLNKHLLPVACASLLCLGIAACGKTDTPVSSDEPVEAFSKTFEGKATGEVAEPEEDNIEATSEDTSEDTAENTSEETSADAGSETEAKEEDSILGHYEGKVYENVYFGFGYELKDATWNYLSQEQILEDTEGAKEWMDNDTISRKLDNVSIFTAMNATTFDGKSSVRVTIEKLNRPTSRASVDAYLESVMKTLPPYLESWNAKDINLELKTMNVFGKEQCTLWLSCTIEGTPFQEVQTVLFHGNYIVTCGASGTKGIEEVASYLEGFYLLPEE